MSDDLYALPEATPLPQARKLAVSTDAEAESEYEAIRATVMESARGRWFLAEHARRSRSTDTDRVLAAIGRIEAAIRGDTALHADRHLRLALTELARAVALTKTGVAAIDSDGEVVAAARGFADQADAKAAQLLRYLESRIDGSTDAADGVAGESAPAHDEGRDAVAADADGGDEEPAIADTPAEAAAFAEPAPEEAANASQFAAEPAPSDGDLAAEMPPSDLEQSATEQPSLSVSDTEPSPPAELLTEAAPKPAAEEVSTPAVAAAAQPSVLTSAVNGSISPSDQPAGRTALMPEPIDFVRATARPRGMDAAPAAQENAKAPSSWTAIPIDFTPDAAAPAAMREAAESAPAPIREAADETRPAISLEEFEAALFEPAEPPEEPAEVAAAAAIEIVEETVTAEVVAVEVEPETETAHAEPSPAPPHQDTVPPLAEGILDAKTQSPADEALTRGFAALRAAVATAEATRPGEQTEDRPGALEPPAEPAAEPTQDVAAAPEPPTLALVQEESLSPPSPIEAVVEEAVPREPAAGSGASAPALAEPLSGKAAPAKTVAQPTAEGRTIEESAEQEAPALAETIEDPAADLFAEEPLAAPSPPPPAAPAQPSMRAAQESAQEEPAQEQLAQEEPAQEESAQQESSQDKPAALPLTASVLAMAAAAHPAQPDSAPAPTGAVRLAPNDPLAPVMALSDEEKIALFS